MNRWLLILLIALLPIQFSWAAIGAYCGDEHESFDEHVLHSKTHAQSDVTTADESEPDSRIIFEAGYDADCGNHCHGHLTPIPVATVSLVADGAGTRWIDEHGARRLLLIQPRPERPQWQTLA